LITSVPVSRGLLLVSLRGALALMLVIPAWAFGATHPAPHILMLEDESAQRPAYLAFMRGFRRELAPLESAVVFTENLDLARFTDPAHLERQSEWLKSKYRDTRIDIVTTGGPRALLIRG